jgi:hypothetical protein
MGMHGLDEPHQVQSPFKVVLQTDIPIQIVEQIQNFRSNHEADSGFHSNS